MKICYDKEKVILEERLSNNDNGGLSSILDMKQSFLNGSFDLNENIAFNNSGKSNNVQYNRKKSLGSQKFSHTFYVSDETNNTIASKKQNVKNKEIVKQARIMRKMEREIIDLRQLVIKHKK